MWKTIAKRSTWALLFSVLCPGLGQIYNGQLPKGLLLFGLALSSLIVSLVVGTLHSFVGLITHVLLGIGIFFYALVDAVRTAISHARSGIRPERAWISYAAGAVLLSAILVLNLPDFVPDKLPGAHAYKVSASSMSPTIDSGDSIIVDMRAYLHWPPSRGDVVMVRIPPSDTLTMKRVIALGGDTIEGDPSEVKVNGNILNEPYLSDDKNEEIVRDSKLTFGPLRVPEGQIFLLGDNRFHSLDSRYYGPIGFEKIRGRALFIYWSNNHDRIGKKIR